MGDVTDALLRWYDEQGRDLPWRRTRDPYAVLVSEVMLQQTQVARVIPRYEAWLERWPDAAALAAASPADVLREWVGLGYNRRALRLRDACVAVARDGWPVTASGLRALPGVGPYTAAAVASFAFDEQVAAVDVNVARVSGRLGTEPAALVPEGRAASFNHAMMDLGATICTARRARCEACPVARLCPSAGVVAAPVPRGGGAAALRGHRPVRPRAHRGGARRGGGGPGRPRGGADRACARGARARRPRRPRRRRGSSALAGHL